MSVKSVDNALPVIIEERPRRKRRGWERRVDVRVGEAPVQTLVLKGSSTGELDSIRKAVFIAAIADDMTTRLENFSKTYIDARPLIAKWRKDKEEAKRLLKANGVRLKTSGR